MAVLLWTRRLGPVFVSGLPAQSSDGTPANDRTVGTEEERSVPFTCLIDNEDRRGKEKIVYICVYLGFIFRSFIFVGNNLPAVNGSRNEVWKDAQRVRG